MMALAWRRGHHAWLRRLTLCYGRSASLPLPHKKNPVHGRIQISSPCLRLGFFFCILVPHKPQMLARPLGGVSMPLRPIKGVSGQACPMFRDGLTPPGSVVTLVLRVSWLVLSVPRAHHPPHSTLQAHPQDPRRYTITQE